MKQDITYKVPGLISQATTAINGARLCGSAGLKQNTEDALLDDQAKLIRTRADHEEGKLKAADLRALLVSLTQESRVFVMVTRDILKLRFGTQYSRLWEALGFRGSLETPRNPNELFAMVVSIKSFFESHPDAQNMELNLTATHADALATNLMTAINAVIVQQTAVTRLLNLRDDAALQMRKRLTGLVAELTQLIDPLDERWLLFGLNMPGARQTPDAPENVEAILVNDTTAMIEFQASPRADYYRVYQRIVGVDAEPVAMGSPVDLDFTLDDLPRHSTIEISVTAVNDGGESTLSSPVTIVTN